jgi:hypothetical protein
VGSGAVAGSEVAVGSVASAVAAASAVVDPEDGSDA